MQRMFDSAKGSSSIIEGEVAEYVCTWQDAYEVPFIDIPGV